MGNTKSNRPIALITGVSRMVGIGAAIARKLSQAGWDIALTYWRPYDQTMAWSTSPTDIDQLVAEIRSYGARCYALEADLASVEAPKTIFDGVESELGSPTALIINHCHCVESDIMTTSIESFDLHFAINVRATWLLIREFAKQFKDEFGSGRILSITSDHTAGNLPYGSSKGAMDRIVLSSAWDFRSMGITANVINPGATDTAWMSDELKDEVKKVTLLNRIGTPQDCANLVSFLCSKDGGWVNAQLLFSDGGLEYKSQ